MDAQDALAVAMAPLRARYVEGARARLAVIEAAADALALGAMTEAMREAALLEAHKLAGSMGTYGMWRGSAYAQDLELALDDNPEAGRLAPLLAGLAAELSRG